MGKTKKKDSWRALSAAGALAAAFFLQAPDAQADPADKVYLPTVVRGEVEAELRGGYQRWRDHDDDRERQFVADVGYAFTSWWKSELAVGVTRTELAFEEQIDVRLRGAEFLLEHRSDRCDVALFRMIARELGKQSQVGPVLSGLGQRKNIFPLDFVEARRGPGKPHPQPGAEIDYAWQVKWRGNPGFEPGVQGFGTLGRTNEFGHDTEHKIGPAFFSQAVLGARNKIKFDAAVLFGLNRNSPDTTVRFNLEYEIY
jgi:hypothetical protein